MTFREKSLWVVGGSLTVAFGLYFWWVLPAPAENVAAEQIGAFVAAVVVLVALQIAGHVLIGAVDRRSAADERDRLIGLIGARNGSFVLAAGVFLSLCIAVLTTGNFLFMHVLLAFWVLAELVTIGTSLALYRRGA